jgi:hypothetical protein
MQPAKKQRTVTVRCRITVREYKTLKREAKECGKSISDMLRYSISLTGNQ